MKITPIKDAKVGDFIDVPGWSIGDLPKTGCLACIKGGGFYLFYICIASHWEYRKIIAVSRFDTEALVSKICRFYDVYENI